MEGVIKIWGKVDKIWRELVKTWGKVVNISKLGGGGRFEFGEGDLIFVWGGSR